MFKLKLNQLLVDHVNVKQTIWTVYFFVLLDTNADCSSSSHGIDVGRFVRYNNYKSIIIIDQMTNHFISSPIHRNI